jgi:hypothetical protein
MAETQPKDKDHPDMKAYEAQREERKRLTDEAIHRAQSTTPTPTQEENDMARMGIRVDEHKDDGSGPTVIETRTVANVPLSAHGYEPTREQREQHQREQQRHESSQPSRQEPLRTRKE